MSCSPGIKTQALVVHWLPAESFLGDLASRSAGMSLAAGAPALARPRSAPQLPSSRTAFRSRRCQALHLSLLSVVPTPPGMANRCLTNRWRVVGTTLPVIEWVVRLGCGSGNYTPILRYVHSSARQVMPRHRLHPESESSVSASDSGRLSRDSTRPPMQLISFPLLQEQQYV